MKFLLCLGWEGAACVRSTFCRHNHKSSLGQASGIRGMSGLIPGGRWGMDSWEAASGGRGQNSPS